jgi:hypothetical protein
MLAREDGPGPAVERMIAQLFGTQNGARGFFVAYLTDPAHLTDNLLSLAGASLLLHGALFLGRGDEIPAFAVLTQAQLYHRDDRRNRGQ